MKAFFEPEPVIFYSTVNSIKYPVNTIEAVDAAFQDGADVVCLNIRLTKDNEIVIAADNDVSKFCEKQGMVSDYTLEELKQSDAGYSFKDADGAYPFRNSGYLLATLEEVFAHFPGKRFNITITDKSSVITEKYIALVQKYNFMDKILTSSLHSENIKLVRKKLPDSATAFTLTGIIGIYTLFKSGLLFFIKKFKADALQTPEAIGVSYIANSGLIEQMHKKRIRVHVWDIKGETQLKRVYETGADGFMVEDIAPAKKFLAAMNKNK